MKEERKKQDKPIKKGVRTKENKSAVKENEKTNKAGKSTRQTAKGLSEKGLSATKNTRARTNKNPMGTSMDGFANELFATNFYGADAPALDKRKKSVKRGQKSLQTREEQTEPKTRPLKKRLNSPKSSNKDRLTEWVSTSVVEPILPAKKQKTKGTSKQKSVKVLFLGGVGEIGKNMTALEYGNDIIIIDAGLTFPNNEDMPGVDSVVPDVTYLVENKEKIRGILLTHGHEDHIGGLPYLMKELGANVPVYGTRLTLMLADNKLQEGRIQSLQRVVEAGEKIRLGVFEVEFINVNHSISGACALAIKTPNGLIYHSGDFKIDLTPVAGQQIDLKRIAELGKEGVLLYMAESTNIERTGYTMSETVVGTTLDHLFSENTNRRIIIATFASNVHRLQQIIDLAVKYRRKVALSGRSMFKVVDAAVKIGELKIPEGVLIDIEKTKNLFDGELLIVSTGSQGEPMSALTRMASGDFNKVTIGEQDTIIISANPIPGNEKMIYRVINNLYKKGARVVYESLEKIHVSGHACQEEHKILHTL